MIKKKGVSAIFMIIFSTAIAVIVFIGAINILIDLNATNLQEDTLCHTSVLTRASSPNAINDFVPLKCATRKYCFTTNWINGDCKEFTNEKNVQYIRLPSDPQGAARLIEKNYAEAMYNCWSLMGEGKLSLFTGGMAKYFNLKPEEVSCVMCARIAFDIKDEEKQKQIFDQINVNEYMRTTQIPNHEQTYLERFTDRSVNAFTAVNEDTLKKLQEKSAQSQVKFAAQSPETVILFSQIHPKSYSSIFDTLSGYATVAGTAFVTPGLSSIVRTGPGILVTLGGAGVLTVVSAANIYRGQDAAAGYCGDKIQQEGNKQVPGCSMVQIVPYDAKTINQICKAIDGNI